MMTKAAYEVDTMVHRDSLGDLHAVQSCPSGRMKMEELFRQWLSLEATKDMICGLVDDVKSGREVVVPAAHTNVSIIGGLAQVTSNPADPCRSPKRPPNHSPAMGPSRRKGSAGSVEDINMGMPEPLQLSLPEDAESDMSAMIPRFYFPKEGGRGRGRAYSRDRLDRKERDIEERFRQAGAGPDGITVDSFVSITKDLCGFPSFFNLPLFQRIRKLMLNLDAPEDDLSGRLLTLEMFQTYWAKEIQPFDNIERFFRLVKQPQNDYIEHSDFAPFLHELLKYHPGLEFLSGTPEFQEKYAATVAVRIFYMVDKDSSGRITLRKLRRSNLVEAFNVVDEEEDINKVNAYFSYEHFYVLYCKFWELDTDHDFLLSRDDLMRYGGHALTRIIVDRIFEFGRRPFARMQTLSPDEKQKLSYEDFIYFMLSEEDKGNPVSLRYWFELIDIIGDNVIRADEMRVYYDHQIHRMECLGQEVVPFEDIMCQMSDLLHPAIEGDFRFTDFTRPDKIRLSGVFFNVLFNLSKFIEFEQRDPFLLRQQMAEPELTDWDRYARAEYARLAMEEEGRENDTAMEIDTMDGWYGSDDDVDVMGSTEARTSAEAPF
ncbi:hypothetical protein SDRG_13910 [Saprolegnia diclina VS20]|uniref:PP2A regulatory subunit B'' EF-hand domain-containing protein n=1 Tax=Saprolegnia diclina (strain VS20) TaxID=1156394 RepID=T0R8G3_SAPDV|nr:hypothetical protein SDRG_13910 [Saprolegnia diclina VS20]EQC28363.1 hypothetical protein SDRG_13910 [Saprolegnia diclina VS20]|eukprot:XP_008618233.1 hypothetical protein SDRG_13910 [Saprolegnia diclina VS20]